MHSWNGTCSPVGDLLYIGLNKSIITMNFPFLFDVATSKL